MSNSLDPDQARHFVGPDLGSNCLQSYQQTTKVATSGERVKINLEHLWSQGSFSGAISQYSRIFLQEIASKFLK